MKPDKHMLFAVITAIIIFSVDLIIPLGVAFGVPYIIVVLISLQISRRHATIVTSIICSLLVVIGFFFSPEGGEAWKIFFNRTIAIVAIWIVALIGLAKKNAEEALQKSHDKLELLVEERTTELSKVNEALNKREDQLNNVLIGASLGYWDWQYKTGKHYVNDRWLAILGLERSDIVNNINDWNVRIHPDDMNAVTEIIKKSFKSKETYVAEFRMKHKDGHWVWIQGSGKVITYDPTTNEPQRLCGTHLDITERKQVENALRESEEKYRGIFDESVAAIYVFDRNRKFTDTNQAGLDLLGYTRKELLNMQITDVDANRDIKVWTPVLKQLLSGKNVINQEHELMRKDGTIVTVLSNTKPLNDDRGHSVGLQSTFINITERKQAEEKLKHMASHDPLTGLYNRNEMKLRLDNEMERASRYNHKLSVFMLDIDHFKHINDTYGHQTGDTVLRKFAKLLENSIRNSDYTARFGGEEFVVILPETELPKARELAERLRKLVDDHIFPINIDKELNLSTSIGIATFPDHVQTSQELLKAADSAMYAAKEAGRNQVKVSSYMSASTVT